VGGTGVGKVDEGKGMSADGGRECN
jgi:hypothetical protein